MWLSGRFALIFALCVVAVGFGMQRSNVEKLTEKQELGKLLFFDTDLSTPPGQSCSSCHSPSAGFANSEADLPVSRGVHKERFGNRNDLTAAYASFSPRFAFDEEEKVYVGGMFWDGRANTLAEQAKGPFLNPLEMANPDAEAVVAKVRRAGYADLFRKIYGTKAFEDTKKAYDYIADAIASYEESPELNRFDSKYDLYLAGKTKLSEQELRGLNAFEDENKGNCATCHTSRPDEAGTPPLFTDFTYDNLGAPKNPENPFYYLPRELNPEGVDYVDLGLGGVLNKTEENGKFRVPSLRNVALTGPYFHNRIFKTLRQVLLFYSTRDVGPWPEPEVSENVNHDELGNLGLTEQEIDDILAFMHTLTDGYEEASLQP